MFYIFLCFKNFFAINDGGNDIGLCHLLDVVVQEVTSPL